MPNYGGTLDVGPGLDGRVGEGAQLGKVHRLGTELGRLSRLDPREGDELS